MDDVPDPARDARLAARLGCIAASALALPVATVLALLDVSRNAAPAFWLHVALPTAAFTLFAWGFARRRVLARLRRGE